MTRGVTLRRPARPRALISVISMIDVLMILLFFFMATSTYLNLDMIPALQSSTEAEQTPAQALAQTQTEAAAALPGTLFIRISARGEVVVAGQRLTHAALGARLQERLTLNPALKVLLLPSGGARLQDLVGAMDAITSAGVTELKVIRVGAEP